MKRRKKVKRPEDYDAKTTYPPPGKGVQFHPGWTSRFNPQITPRSNR